MKPDSCASRHATISAMRLTIGLIIASSIALVSSAGLIAAETVSNPPCAGTDPFCYQPVVSSSLVAFEPVTVPKIATPIWLSAQPSTATRVVTYSVATRGTVTADFDEFKATAASVYNSSLGWSRLGVSFSEVATGGDFTLWLAEDVQVPSFSSSVCDSTYSCSTGRNVIINQTRWLNGSGAWNETGSALGNYRTMVLNHELGHWLGHGHRFCSSDGAPAPVMQQQSMSMQGCATNPWPLANELYAPNLGIRS